MSRESWYSSVRQGAKIGPGTDVATLLDELTHKPLARRTSDPEAADYDEAVELFTQGVQLARSGDLEAACGQIATAYLLDARSINVSQEVPEDPRARALCVDMELLGQLAQLHIQDLHCVTYGGHVLRLLIAQKLGNDPDMGQNFFASAIVSVNYLMQRLEEEPRLGAHYSQGGALGGCMTWTNLLYQRSTIYMAMGNHRETIRDLTKALDHDPGYLPAREARASLWATLQLKDDNTIFGEYKRLVGEAHPDHRGLEVAYARLGCLVLRDPKLGTLADAKLYYEKCLRASMRRTELYGPHKSGKDTPAVQLLKEHYAMTMTNPEVRQVREQCDVAVATGNPENISIPESFEVMPQTKENPQVRAHTCLKCGKSGQDIGDKLYKCSQCRRVSYCSRECQRADWKKHKAFCNSAKLKLKDFAAPTSEEDSITPNQSSSRTTYSAAKEPIDEVESCYLELKRMTYELKLLWERYGTGFATWWKGMNRNKQLQALMEVTNNTLPISFNFTNERHVTTARGLLEQRQMSGCCIGLDAEYFLGSCGCQDQSQHFCSQKVLHLLHLWTQKTDEARQQELQLCKAMVDALIFPRVGPKDCFVMPPIKENEDLRVLMISDNAPAGYREKIQGYVAGGLVSDFDSFTYAATRNGRIVGLLVKLFDQYQERIRRQLTKNPWERLHGCEHCLRGCNIDEEATSCKTCTMTWWCCKGCKEASAHGKTCPHGRRMDSAVIFRF